MNKLVRGAHKQESNQTTKQDQIPFDIGYFNIEEDKNLKSGVELKQVDALKVVNTGIVKS